MDYYIHLDKNENQMKTSPKAMEVLKNIDDLSKYYDIRCDHLREKLAERHKVELDQIIIGNGSLQIIYDVIRSFYIPPNYGDSVVTSEESYPRYEEIAEKIGGRSYAVPAKDHKYDLEKIAGAINESNTGAVYIANPNNPTGTYVNRKELDWFMNKMPKNVFVVIDEAYVGFVTAKDFPDSIKYIKNREMTGVQRTISKLEGGAAIRMGYLITSKTAAEKINKIILPYCMSEMNQKMAIAAIEDTEHIEKSKRMVAEGKDYLMPEYIKLGLDPIPSQGNFILVKGFKETSEEVAEKFKEKNILVMPITSVPNSVRITVGLKWQNERVIGALEHMVRK